MSLPQIVFVTTVGVALTVLVLELVRRRLLREKYSLAWVVVSLGMATTALFYDLYAVAARLVGIVEVTSLFFFLAIVGQFLFSLQFSLALSTAWRQRKALVHEVALLEARVRSLEASLASPPAKGVAGDQSQQSPTNRT